MGNSGRHILTSSHWTRPGWVEWGNLAPRSVSATAGALHMKFTHDLNEGVDQDKRSDRLV